MLNRRYLANAIRVLSMDAVEKAHSGHPGMPMGMADIAEVLWSDFLKHNPRNPKWPNRDRFLLSNGHGSMLLYSLLHLTGYDLSLEELKHFRQLHSKTPGHPENLLTPGVETTTGPLGQGLANAIGMALSEKMLAARFNKPDFPLIDHYTYVFLGDGCLMEGISHEVCSLAGTWGLGKLIAFWDDNGISIDGHTIDWFTDNTPERFKAYHWHVIEKVDGHDAKAVYAAILEARAVTDKPTLICCKTTIGFGAPNAAGHEKCHGAPLGEKEVQLVRETLGWHHPPFEIPQAVYDAWSRVEKGAREEHAWQTLYDSYAKEYPHLAKQYQSMLDKQLPDDWQENTKAFIAACQSKQTSMATRKASQLSIEHYAKLLPELIGGSADLTGSNLTNWSGSVMITRENFEGNYIYFGVREFGMTAIANGMALHGEFIPYIGTFLTFCDYARNAVRMAALMRAQVVLVYTHDSIGLGEDGPTHQPIEHITMLRATPNLAVWRPCDMVETAVAWQKALENKKAPTALLLSRQTLPAEERNEVQLENVARGGYILYEPEMPPMGIFIATGSEVHIAMMAARRLLENHIPIRVVSMPCMEVFNAQDAAYQASVLPDAISKRIAIEAGASLSWYRYVGTNDHVMGLDHFGESAPGEDIFKAFGFTADNLVNKTIELWSIK